MMQSSSVDVNAEEALKQAELAASQVALELLVEEQKVKQRADRAAKKRNKKSAK